MKNKRKPFGLLLIGILLLLMWGTGCTTSLGLGLGFGSGGTSLALGVSTTLPREEKTDMWEMQGFSLPKKAGEQVTLTFPKGGSAKGKVWGTDLYAEKSTIGMAAVHSGLITFQEGGSVTVQREEKAKSFFGIIRHGVKSLSLNKKSGAFSFVKIDD